jgi:selenocysteine-specific elongation factor
MSSCAIAVIGHVDHGKTSLVRALTGVDTDRLPEEKARGLSIALGFAHRLYPSGVADFIDAPGHADFVRTMVAGASGAQSILLVVSAVDGFERQTREHLQIAMLLGVTAGVVAVTKSDLLTRELWDGRAQEIEQDLCGTPLAGEPIIFCSARTGAGLEQLNAALDALILRRPPAPRLPGFFLPADRVFGVQGVGTVATGTLLGEAVAAGAEAVVEPTGRSVSIRSLQTRGVTVRQASAGARIAVQLRGASEDDVRPGDVICAPGVFGSALQIDARVTVLPAARPLKHLEQVRFLIGARSMVASARLLGGRTIEGGGQGWVQLRFEHPVPSYAGQRGVLRRLSPAETIGGATVLDPAAAPCGRRAAERIAVLDALHGGDPATVALALAARDRGVVSLPAAARVLALAPATLTEKLGSDFEPISDGLLAPRRWLGDAARAYVAAVSEAHRSAPLRPAVSADAIKRGLAVRYESALIDYVANRLIALGEIVSMRAEVALRGHDPLAALSAAQRAQMDGIEALLRAAAASPPDPDEIRAARGAGDLLDLLIDLGRVIPLRNYALRKTVLFHADALTLARRALAAAFPPPTAFTTGEARAALATSRKFIVPLLEGFDARGWTLRDGDTRQIAHPLPE